MSNPTRLLALGLLARQGPMHGHQIRRRAELLDVGEWGGVQIGSLYAALHRMEAEELIATVRQERPGNFPARTVYAITDEGRRELSVLRQEALQGDALRNDPIDVALIVSAGSDESELRSLLDTRLRRIEATLTRFGGGRARLEKNGYLRPSALAVFRHCEARLEAERAWHAELGALLGPISAERSDFDAATAENAAKPAERVARPAPKKSYRNPRAKRGSKPRARAGSRRKA